MKPVGVHEPRGRGGWLRATVITLMAVAGAAALAFGLFLGVGDVVERIREVGTTTVPVSASTLPPVTTTPATVTTTTSVTDPTDVMTVSDDSGRLSIVVPVAWSDVNGSAWDRAGTPVGIQVGAAPDLEAWQTGWGTPGVFVGVSDSVPVDEAFGDWSDSCSGRAADEDFAPVGMQGTMEVWEGCGAEGSTFLVGVAQPADASIVLVFQAVVLGDADREAADQVVATLSYLP
jgi:hypothetical protein